MESSWNVLKNKTLERQQWLFPISKVGPKVNNTTPLKKPQEDQLGRLKETENGHVHVTAD